MKVHTAESQATVTPEKALMFLKEGNSRFINNLKVNRNLLEQVNDTRDGQWPFSVILSCIDSRTSAELIFDQGLGDIFSIRIAGNILNCIRKDPKTFWFSLFCKIKANLVESRLDYHCLKNECDLADGRIWNILCEWRHLISGN